MNINKSCCISILVLLFISGCDMQVGGAFGSSNKEFMTELKEELTNSGISFTEEPDGMIYYSPKHNNQVEKLRETIEKRNRSSTSFQLKSEDTIDYVTALMKEKGYEYRLVQKGEETWIKWHPKNEEQEQNIMLKYVEYEFSKMKVEKNCDEGSSLQPDAQQ